MHRCRQWRSAERKRAASWMQQMHANFKDVVKAARGSALKLDNPDLLEGDWWYDSIYGHVCVVGSAVDQCCCCAWLLMRQGRRGCREARSC